MSIKMVLFGLAGGTIGAAVIRFIRGRKKPDSYISYISLIVCVAIGVIAALVAFVLP